MGILTTLTGNVTADSELRHTQTGLAVTSFTVAVNERRFNKQSNDWEDGEAQFVRCSVWRDQAEHVAASVRKGMRVTIVGKIGMSTYTDREGAERSSLEMQVDECAVSLRYGTVEYHKAERRGQTEQGNRQYAAPVPATQGAVPAGTQPQWTGDPYDETPF